MTRLRLRPRPGGISAAAPVETTAASDRRPIAALVAVMLVFAALTSVVAVATPAWEAADEPSHVHNVETLVAGHWYRIPRHVSLKIPSELHQPPLYYALLAGFQRVAGRPVEPVTPGPVNFGFVRPFRHGFYKHHSAEQHRFLLLLRLPNVVLGLAAILLTFLTARAISGDAWTPAIAAAIVAFVPRFVFLSAFVTNDNLVNALGAALAYCTVRCVRAPGWRWAAAVGAVLGLLLITKVSALPVAAVLIPVALAAGTRKRRATVLAVAAAAVAVVGGWYLVQNQVRYGDPLATSATQHYLQLSGNLRPFSRAPYVVTDPLGLVFSNVPSRIIRGYWYTSGWNQFRWPLGGSLPFWAALAFALSGLVSARLGGARGQPRRSNALLTLGVLAVAGFISVWVVAFQTPFYQPRLALVGLPALGCLAALGLERWRLPIRAVLPLMGLVGTLIAIQHDVLSLPWSQ